MYYVFTLQKNRKKQKQAHRQSSVCACNFAQMRSKNSFNIHMYILPYTSCTRKTYYNDDWQNSMFLVY